VIYHPFREYLLSPLISNTTAEFSGQTLYCPYVGPLNTCIAFLNSKSSQVNNLDKSLLCKFHSTIQCNKEDVFTSLPSDQILYFLNSLKEIHFDLKSLEKMQPWKMLQLISRLHMDIKLHWYWVYNLCTLFA
jgi:hypothetical protein